MAQSFDFIQSSPSATWTITHNLNRRPGTEVFSNVEGQFQQMLPESVKYPNLNTTVIEFSIPRSGKARLV